MGWGGDWGGFWGGGTPPAPGAVVPGTYVTAPVAVSGLQYAEIYLDPATGDIALPIQIVYGEHAVLQRVYVRFKLFLGEWFLDQRIGVPYYRDIFIKNPDSILISFIFRQVLLTTPGIKDVASFLARLDRPTRRLYVNFEATLEDGSVIRPGPHFFIIG
jgi:hypothetical protein